MVLSWAAMVPKGLRVAQILFSVIVMACAAYQVSLSAGWYSYGPINFSLFTSITGLLVSSLLLVGPLYNQVLAERLPGLIDIILSGLWSLFSLSGAASLASMGGCRGWVATGSEWWYPYYFGHRKMLGVHAAEAGRQLLASSTVCGTWDAVIAFGFLSFALYAASAVYAGLDLKSGKGLVKPRGFKAAQAAPGGPITN